MDDIIYEEEKVLETVFEGDLILDGHMNEEQQRQSIFRMMRNAGIEVVDEDKYTIGYDGAEDNDGLSETQTSHFVVQKEVTKKVPYKVTREEIYSGEWILDGLRISVEEQRQRILQMMKADGVEVSPDEEIEIGYEGASDHDGISETQSTRFVVYRVKKEKVEEEKKDILTRNNDEKEKIEKIYQELLELKRKVLATTDAKEITELSLRMEEVSNQLDTLIQESTRDYTLFENVLAQIEKEIHDIQEAIAQNMKEYMDSYDRIKEILKDETNMQYQTMTLDELDAVIQGLMSEKLAENEESLMVRTEIERQMQVLKELVKKRDRVRKDFEEARALGISASEYKELTVDLRSRNLLRAIFEQKGLGELYRIPAKDRTPEQKKQIREIRKEIFEELARLKKENEEKDVLSLVEALYGIETNVKLKGKQRVLIVKQEDLHRIQQNASKLPEKIVKKEETTPSYQPGEVPEDMRKVFEKRQEEVVPEVHEADHLEDDRKEVIDKFTFFRNDAYPDKVFVRSAAFERFDIEPIEPAVRIEGTLCYEILPNDAFDIIRNANNEVSPYVVEYRDADLEWVREDKDEKMDSYEGPVEQITIFNGLDDGKQYARNPVFERFDIDPIGEGVRIEGTLCYEMSKEDADRIEEHAFNDVSPYSVVHRVAPVMKNEVAETTSIMERPTEQITIFENDGKYYVRKPVFERFDTMPMGPEVRIEGTACQEIHPEDVEEILANASNEVSPYQVVHRAVDEVVEEKSPKVMSIEDVIPYDDRLSTVVEDPMPYNDRVSTIVEDPMPYNDRVSTIVEEPMPYNDQVSTIVEEPMPYNDQVSTIKDSKEDVPIVEEIPTVEEEETSDEYIPGTKIKKPRERRYDEPDEVYVQYLRDYYGRVFGSSQYEHLDENNRGLKDKIVVFRDKESGRCYARKPVFDRFDVEPIGEEVRLEGVSGYEIDPRDVEDIASNQNNSTSPYIVEYRDGVLDIGKKEETPAPKVEEQPQEDRGLMDRIVIFRDKESGHYYARKPVFDRFDAETLGDEVRLEGVAGYEIDPRDVDDIVAGQDNDVSPYRVEFRDVSLVKGENVPTPPVPPVDDTPTDTDTDIDTDDHEPVPPVVDTPEDDDVVDTPEDDVVTPPPVAPENVETITLYRDINDNGQVYAPDDVLKKFGIKISPDSVMVEGVPCHKISSDTDQIIRSIAQMSKDPKMVVQYVDVQLKKKEEVKPRPHVEEIIDKLTTDLDIHAKDSKRYTASNLRISKTFSDELHSGNYAYNIVHVVPATLKAGISVFRKLSGKILTTKRATDVMKKLEERLDDLSEEELEVLFEEYKGSQLKTDMNHQINPLILERLREFGLHKVERLNEQMKEDYSVLFALLGQIGALEEKIETSDKDSSSLETQRLALMKEASLHIQSILTCRRQANNLLSSGVHGLEEDFKAVQTKLSYVGMRFGKVYDFDNELQHRLGTYGSRLNQAIASGDDEKVVSSFIALESCYSENTAIEGSIVGKRSVGSKYYSPLAEQFDYRDDPFIRDLFTTVAVTSAAISAVNAIRVHQIESQQLLQQQQAQANTVNAHNNAAINYTHQTGQQISQERGTFQEGMEAQAHQDVLSHANTTERASLDTSNWQFSRAYHAADHAGHAAYNQFNADVTSQINAVTSDYAQGLITQAEALERMAQISTDAQATLESVVQSALPILRSYASTHPQFDLTAVEESMQYIVSHPNAIADMNQAMVNVTNLADGLQSVYAMPMVGLSYLPSDMASTIVCAASAALLAANVSSSMKKSGKKGKYGNEVTDMMDDYLQGVEQEEEEEDERERSRRS